MSGPCSPSSPRPGDSPAGQPLGLELLRCPCCRLLLWEPVTASCGHSFCKPCLGGAGPSRCPLCQERLELLGVGEARCSVVLCGILERCVQRQRRMAGLAERVRDRLARGDAREALRMAQRGVELGKDRRARGLAVRMEGCGVPGVCPRDGEARAGLLRQVGTSVGTNVGHRVPAARCAPSLHAPELGDVGSWKCCKGGLLGMGMGRGSAAAGDFFPIRGCPEVLGAVGCRANRAARPLPGPHRLCPIGHVLLARKEQQILASCSPAVFRGQRKSSAQRVAIM